MYPDDWHVWKRRCDSHGEWHASEGDGCPGCDAEVSELAREVAEQMAKLDEAALSYLTTDQLRSLGWAVETATSETAAAQGRP